jgi:hypothetical protein
MKQAYRNFFRGTYMNTGGFMPTEPLKLRLYPGDFYQIKNGEMIVLGNIFRNGLVDQDEVRISDTITLNPSSWNFGEGVRKPYSGRGSGQNIIEGEFEYSKQILAFDHIGSYLFKGNEPESIKITNWNEFQQKLIIKLTQTIFSFREVYVVTEVATTKDWSVVISGSHEGELEIATENDNFGLVDIFGHGASKTIQSKDIEYYNKELGRKPNFFKSKKLVVQNEKLEVFISDLINRQSGMNLWVNDFYSYEFDTDSNHYENTVSKNARASLLDMLQANELNPNTALLYFRWEDSNLDDIEKLFIEYEY